MVARGLLLCGACLIGMAFAEAVAARWGAPPRSMPAVPAGDPELPASLPRDGDKNEVTPGRARRIEPRPALLSRTWLSVGEIVAWKLGEAVPGTAVSRRGPGPSGRYIGDAVLRPRRNCAVARMP